MQTTLRINDAHYHEAKTEVARAGMTLTHFIEDALKGKLNRKAAKPITLPSHDSGYRLPKDFDLVSLVREEEAAYSTRLAEKLTSKKPARKRRV
jgi:hypothetical protein